VALEPWVARYHYQLGSELEELGRSTEAQAAYDRGSQLDRNWPEVHRRLAWLLATTPEEQHRNGLLAVHLARPACWTGAGPESLDTLAAALAAANRFDEAAAAAERAQAAASAAGRSELAGQIAARVCLYKQQQPFRQTE
jgi:hypothetical protein